MRTRSDIDSAYINIEIEGYYRVIGFYSTFILKRVLVSTESQVSIFPFQVSLYKHKICHPIARFLFLSLSFLVLSFFLIMKIAVIVARSHRKDLFDGSKTTKLNEI